jgi:uncharacterized protein YybS (DUF2232 family)
MVWPVPVIIVGYRNGLKASILSAMSAGLIVSLLTQPLIGLGLLIGFGLPGILMGYMIGKKVNPYIIIFLCGLVLSLTMVGEFLISLKVSGIDLLQFLSQIDATMKSQLETTLDMYRRLGIAEKEMQRMSEYFAQSVEAMKLIFPSALIVSGLLSAFVDYKLTGLILKRIGHSIPDTERFSKWRLREPYSYILVGLVALAIAASYLKIPFLTAVATNISTVIMLILSIIGLSVIIYFARVYGDRNGIPKGLRIAIVAFILIAFAQFIAMVGILDMAFDFRKLRAEKQC